MSWKTEGALTTLKAILLEYGEDLSAVRYDALKLPNKPARTSLRRLLETDSWKKIKEAALTGNATIFNKNESTEEKISKEFGKDTALITTKSLHIQTLDDALEASDVDLKIWEVDRYIINSWEVTMGARNTTTGEPETYTNYQVKVWLKRIVTSPTEDAIKLLIKNIPKFKPPKVKRKIPDTPYALEIAPYDVHFGQFAWGKETGHCDQDLNIISEYFQSAIEQNLNSSAGFNISKIFYVVGQDLFHSENYKGITTLSGNILDMDSRLPKIYQKGKEGTLKAIYMCREVAPVEVLWVPGNHDIHVSYYLCDLIGEHFSNDKFVEVDVSPNWRKARLWGNLLIGWAHEAERKQVNIVNMLPQWWPELWGQSKYREWHTGHLHKKGDTKYKPIDEVGGVLIRRLPALCAIDAWHYHEKYIDHIPASDCFILSRENGVQGTFTAFVGEGSQ